ncbi:hypothetical protein ACFVKB_43415 [Rhodococcus sp. NPDC127530]|uniref:hypothetical protein n=1 Tax=unclassified Rhodococcus (in: high G+C Gram-positive bacteria) TaxID=192944 RepID=UPI003645A671
MTLRCTAYGVLSAVSVVGFHVNMGIACFGALTTRSKTGRDDGTAEYLGIS